MRKVVEKIMGQYGTDLVLSGSGGEKTVRGFFRAVNAKSWQGMESQATALGEISRGQYVCMVPAAEEVREGDTLGLGGKTYLVRRAEIYFYGNAPIYRWGLCVEKGVNDTWGSRS